MRQQSGSPRNARSVSASPSPTVGQEPVGAARAACGARGHAAAPGSWSVRQAKCPRHPSKSSDRVSLLHRAGVKADQSPAKHLPGSAAARSCGGVHHRQGGARPQQQRLPQRCPPTDQKRQDATSGPWERRVPGHRTDYLPRVGCSCAGRDFQDQKLRSRGAPPGPHHMEMRRDRSMVLTMMSEGHGGQVTTGRSRRIVECLAGAAGYPAKRARHNSRAKRCGLTTVLLDVADSPALNPRLGVSRSQYSHFSSRSCDIESIDVLLEGGHLTVL